MLLLCVVCAAVVQERVSVESMPLHSAAVGADYSKNKNDRVLLAVASVVSSRTASSIAACCHPVGENVERRNSYRMVFICSALHFGLASSWIMGGLGLTGHGPRRLIALHVRQTNDRLTHSASWRFHSINNPRIGTRGSPAGVGAAHRPAPRHPACEVLSLCLIFAFF